MAVPGFLTDLNVLSILLFLAALTYIMWRDRENIERHSVVFVRRTKRGIELLDRTADLMPTVWRWWANVGVVVGFVVMVGIFGLLLQQTLKLFMVSGAAPPVGPVVPTVSTVTNPQEAGYLGIPFWHFLISLSVVMVVHEMMHGVIARVEGFDIEYVGLLLLAIIPGAFVQPKGQRDFFDTVEKDEDQEPWGDGSPVARMRVMAAGPFANLTFAALLMVLFTGMFTSVHGYSHVRGAYDHHGMRIVNVSDGSPAEAVGLQPGMTITRLGDASTRHPAEFRQATTNLSVNQSLTIETRGNGTFTATLGERPDRDRNYTYTPAPVDHVLPALERAVPGSVVTYTEVDDLVIGEEPRREIARWRWLAAREPSLNDTADRKISELRSEISTGESGYLGIVVLPDRTAAAWYEPIAAPLMIVLAVLRFVMLISVMVGAANLLPIKGLDGGWMLDTLLNEYLPERGPAIVRSATMLTLGIVGISFAFLAFRIFL